LLSILRIEISQSQGSLMKPARVIILPVALLAAGAAAFLALQLTGRERVVEMQAETVIKREPVISVLVAAANLPVGSRLTEESMRWQGFPENGIVEGFITEQNRPQALAELKDAIIRMPMFEGEPFGKDRRRQRRDHVVPAPVRQAGGGDRNHRLHLGGRLHPAQ
jgi:Flp pilus assembly protein CpaB